MLPSDRIQLLLILTLFPSVFAVSANLTDSDSASDAADDKDWCLLNKSSAKSFFEGVNAAVYHDDHTGLYALQVENSILLSVIAAFKTLASTNSF